MKTCLPSQEYRHGLQQPPSPPVWEKPDLKLFDGIRGVLIERVRIIADQMDGGLSVGSDAFQLNASDAKAVNMGVDRMLKDDPEGGFLELGYHDLRWLYYEALRRIVVHRATRRSPDR